jgi:rod shape-determining protein MreC
LLARQTNETNLANKQAPGSSRWFGAEGSRTARLMMYILLAIVLMSMDQRGHYVPKIRSVLEQVFEPVFILVGYPARLSDSIATQTRSRRALIDENQLLLEQLFKTAGSVQTHAALTQENQRLRNLLDATRGRAYDFSFAEMIRVDLDPFSHKVWIDHGAGEGVVSGQAVIDGLGVVGQVEDVFRHSSTVRLISDPDHALPVQINRTGLRSVAFGTGETSHLIMPNVPLQADVSPGDIVVTSGLGDRFPPGFPVGEVERVQRERGDTFARVYLRPSAALDRGREVLLVEPYVPAAVVEGQEP